MTREEIIKRARNVQCSSNIRDYTELIIEIAAEEIESLKEQQDFDEAD